NVSEAFVELLGPKRLSAVDAYQLNGNADPIPGALDVALEHRLHVKVPAHYERIGLRSRVAGNGACGPYTDAMYLTKTGNQRIGQTEAQKVIRVAGRQRSERQHRYRTVPGTLADLL